MSMEFKVITPDEVAVAATVEYVYLPGSLGEMGVLEHHTALITSLEPGNSATSPWTALRKAWWWAPALCRLMTTTS